MTDETLGTTPDREVPDVPSSSEPWYTKRGPRTKPKRPRVPDAPKPKPTITDFIVSDRERERRHELYRAAARNRNVEQRDHRVIAEFAFPATQQIREAEAQAVERRISFVTRDEFNNALRSIIAGVAPHVAVLRSTGLSYKTFRDYIHRGTNTAEKDPRFALFGEAIERAVAMARGEAEERVFLGDPLSWLMRGPGGRSSADNPGWTPEERERIEPESARTSIIQNILVILEKVAPQVTLP